MKRIPRTLHAPALQRTENNERVATYAQNFKDAPRASVTTRGKQREGRHLRPEFRGRSTRQRHDAPETARGSPLTPRSPRILRTLHAPASPRAENNERVASCAQNFDDSPETGRGSPLTARISRTLHAPASPRAGNSERVATHARNFKDAPRASVTTRLKQ